MPSAFDKIIYSQDLAKTRILLIAAAVSSLAFYFFMTAVNPTHQDWLNGRIAITICTTVALGLTFIIKNIRLIWMRLFVNFVIFLYIVIYVYLLYINDWSIFHRWSYFVLLSIVSTALLTWKDFVGLTIIGFAIPFLLSFTSPLSSIEIWHFHLTNLATLIIIGISVKSNFRYRQESSTLTLKMIEHSKMLALGEMSAGVAHEINNPLTVLMSSATVVETLLNSKNTDQTKIVNYLQKITRSAQRIANIVLALRNFSIRDDSEPIAEHDMRDIITGAFDLFNEKLRANSIAVDYAPSQIAQTCRCRKFQIIQIIVNLMNNAIEAVLEAKTTSEIKIRVEDNSSTGVIKISIIDSGQGVPVAIEDKIMQPFFTTKDIGKGTGLGLSVSFGIAKSHDGKLYLNTDVSRSCFTLELPK